MRRRIGVAALILLAALAVILDAGVRMRNEDTVAVD